MRFPPAPWDLSVGRAADCDVPLCRDTLGSRRHVTLRCKDGRFTVRDTPAWPSIRVNGRPVLQCPVVDGDRIAPGATLLEHRQKR